MSATEDTKPVIKQYFSNAQFTRFPLKNGVLCHFVDHKFRTKDPKVQKELEEEMDILREQGQGNLFYIKKDQHIVDSLIEDPYAELRKKIAAEERQKVLAEIARESGVQPNITLDVNAAPAAKAATPVNPAHTGKAGMATSVDVGGKSVK
jgi:hypothetical protein